MTPSIHNHILSLARAGNPVRAWAVFEAQGLGEAHDDPRALTLKGRLLKDRAERSPSSERAALFAQSAAAYLAAHALKADSYPLINAASMALMAGDSATAREHAKTVLAMIEADPNEGETAYWREATRAEAHLLLGDPGKARATLAQGIAKLPRAYEDHAATLAQFERILAQQAAPNEWLDTYRPPSAVHFSGLIGLEPTNVPAQEDIAQAAAELAPGFAFGALAAGADILWAEAFIEAGAELFVTLPCDRDTFRENSVEPFGRHWVDRFETLIDQAERVVELQAPASWEETVPFAAQAQWGSLVSMGEASRQRDVLRCQVRAVTLAGQSERQRNALAIWEQAGLELVTLETGRADGATGNAGHRADPLPDIAFTGEVHARGGTNSLLEEIAAESALTVQGEADQLIVRGDPGACIDFALRVQSLQADAAMGLGLRMILGPTEHVETPSSQLDFARLGQSGQIITEATSALVSKMLHPAIRIEETGEAFGAAGRSALYAITR